MSLQLAGPGAGAFTDAVPGQFAELDVSGAALPPMRDIPENLRDAAVRDIILRRPFSFTFVRPGGQSCRLGLLYCVVGPATVRMAALRPGDRVGILGPLGRGFSVPPKKTTALLVAGGMGAPPLQHLAGYLASDKPGVRAVALAGARTAAMLPFDVEEGLVGGEPASALREFAECGVKSLVATDDGSLGFAGPVSGLLEDRLEKTGCPRDETIIYACGPGAMCAAVAKVAAAANVDCQVSMERMMACGVGICQGCAVECRVPGSGETVYKLCCEDGPVFDAAEVVF
jgi:dihydroorotate dehydrogenase electron transfer subunit